MRVVVTGGAGFIGSRLVHAYHALGWPTMVVDNLSSGAASTLPPGVTLEVADVAERSVVGRIARFEPDLVIHAAAQISVPRSIADPVRDRAVNVTGTANVVAGAREGGASRFVFVSSGGAIYGEADGADESTAPAPKSPYGRSKLEAEGVVVASGMSYGIARPANAYGPGQRSDLEGGVVAIFIDRMIGGFPIEIHGDGLQRRDLVHVDDVASAVATIAASSRDGVWNVGTGVPTTILDLVLLLRSLTGSSSPVTHAPSRAGDVTISSLTIERISSELGWRPRYDLSSGLAATVAARLAESSEAVTRE